ncbi:MAG TPA: AtpZ/AtpI family protein [Phycisphaerae bacterium]|nr:AtpZ/AtpI family protein [Phycisphaerae bacterium]
MEDEKSSEKLDREKSHQDVRSAHGAMERLETHTEERLAGQTAGAGGGIRKFAGMGFEFLGVILIFGLIGHWLDETYHWNGVATMTAILVGFVGEMYLQIKSIMRWGKK